MKITSYFTTAGIPTLGLVPTIQVWEISGTSSVSVLNDSMIELSAPGFYVYEFSNNYSKDYLVSIDGGITLSQHDRYKVVSISATSELADQVASNVLNSVVQGTNTVATTLIELLDLGRLLLKYEANRTKLDQVNKTLTVYDDDNITPLKVFALKDFAGLSSLEEIAERMPL
jgi:hypothetical protein